MTLPSNAVYDVVYATADDYTAWTATDPPANIGVLLRSASRLIREATAGAYYLTDASGLPTEVENIAAFRDATCAQAAAWVALNINPLAGGALISGVKTSKSLDGASVTYADAAAAAAARAAAVNELVPDARSILDALGLTQTRVWTYG